MKIDYRCKLTPEQRQEIKELWKMGYHNYTHLGLRFGVHPKTIRKVIDDDFRKACNEFNMQNWERYRPSKEHHAELMRIYRKKKKKKILKKLLTQFNFVI